MGNQLKRPVRSPKGDFPSVTTAAKANGTSNFYAIQKAKAGVGGWAYLGGISNRTAEPPNSPGPRATLPGRRWVPSMMRVRVE